jgi:hypothetical protein
MPSVATAGSAAPQVNLPTINTTHQTHQPAENLAAGLVSIAKTSSVSVAATEGAIANGAQPLPLNKLDSFGAGTIVDAAG